MTLCGRLFGVQYGVYLSDKYRGRNVKKVNIEVRYVFTRGEGGLSQLPHFLILIHEVERTNGRPSLFPDVFQDGPWGFFQDATRHFLPYIAQGNAKELADYFNNYVGIEAKLIGEIDPRKLRKNKQD